LPSNTRLFRHREDVAHWTQDCFCYEHLSVIVGAYQELLAVVWVRKHAGPLAAAVGNTYLDLL